MCPLGWGCFTPCLYLNAYDLFHPGRLDKLGA
jgi:hypothetical protein